MLPGPWLMSGIVVVTASVAAVAWTQPDLPLAIRAGAGAVAAAALIADPTFRDAVGRVAVRLRIQRGPTPGSGSEDSRPDIGHG